MMYLGENLTKSEIESVARLQMKIRQSFNGLEASLLGSLKVLVFN